MKVKGKFRMPSRVTYVFPTEFRYTAVDLSPASMRKIRPHALRDLIVMREKLKAWDAAR